MNLFQFILDDTMRQPAKQSCASIDLVLMRRLNTFASGNIPLKLDYYFSICKIFFSKPS